MPLFKHCPGIRSLVSPKIIVRTCPNCGEEVEFFEYETEQTCPNCGKVLHREATESCVAYCKYAEECIEDLEKRGLITPERARELREIMRKSRASK